MATAPLSAQPDAVISATNSSAGQLRDAASTLTGGVSNDPAVRAALDRLSGTSRANLQQTANKQNAAGAAMNPLTAADQQGRAALGGVSAQTAETGGMQFFTGFMAGFSSGMRGGAAAMNGGMGMPGMGMGMGGMGGGLGGAMSGYPAGTKMVSTADLQSLLSGMNGTPTPAGLVTGGGATPWSGSTAPDPISVKQVALQKVSPASTAQLSAAVDSAMTKRGITDPAARAKWKQTLFFIGSHESNGNVNAVNMSDSNAVGETASDGAPAGATRNWLQQTPQTFASNHAAGTSNNMYDPEAAAGADITYLENRYHATPDGGGLDAFMAARSPSYHGY